MDLTNPQIIMRDKEIARLREELAAEIKMRNVWQCAYEESREELAAAQAVIEQMREALGNLLCRAETEYQALTDGEHGNFFEFPEAKFATATYHTTTNLDALHEARALECERLAALVENRYDAQFLTEEAAAHRARKQATKGEEK